MQISNEQWRIAMEITNAQWRIAMQFSRPDGNAEMRRGDHESRSAKCELMMGDQSSNQEMWETNDLLFEYCKIMREIVRENMNPRLL